MSKYKSQTLFTEAFKQSRKQTGLSQEAFADLLGMPGGRARVSHLETGRRFPTAATLDKYMNALGIEFEVVLKEKQSFQRKQCKNLHGNEKG